MSNKQFRITIRWIHILVAAITGTFLYSPWTTDPTFVALMQFVVFPLMLLTGVALWQQPKILKMLKG